MIFYNRRGKIRLLACCSCALSGVRATGYYYGAPHEPWNRRDGRRRGIAAGRSQCWASAGGAQPSGPRNVREDGKGTQGCAEKAEGESGRFLHVRRRRPIPVRSRVRRAVFRARLFFFFISTRNAVEPALVSSCNGRKPCCASIRALKSTEHTIASTLDRWIPTAGAGIGAGLLLK